MIESYSSLPVDCNKGQRHVWYQPSKIKLSIFDEYVQLFNQKIAENQDVSIIVFDSLNCDRLPDDSISFRAYGSVGNYFSIHYYRSTKLIILQTYIEFDANGAVIENGGYRVRAYSFNRCCEPDEALARVRALLDTVRATAVGQK